jgi:hypothetical protein
MLRLLPILGSISEATDISMMLHFVELVTRDRPNW